MWTIQGPRFYSALTGHEDLEHAENGKTYLLIASEQRFRQCGTDSMRFMQIKIGNELQNVKMTRIAMRAMCTSCDSIAADIST